MIHLQSFTFISQVNLPQCTPVVTCCFYLFYLFFWWHFCLYWIGKLRYERGEDMQENHHRSDSNPGPSTSRNKPLHMCARSTNWANRVFPNHQRYKQPLVKSESAGTTVLNNRSHHLNTFLLNMLVLRFGLGLSCSSSYAAKASAYMGCTLSLGELEVAPQVQPF